MKILMCPFCFELYNADYLQVQNEKWYCPKPSCRHKLVEIDEQIAIVISLLNRKGYETLYCCSGHPSLEPGDLHPYIFFKAWSIPDTLPEGWEYEKADRSKQCTITLKSEKISYWQGLENLHKWALELPKIKNNQKEEEE